MRSSCPICGATFLSPLAHPAHTPKERRLERTVRRCIQRWKLRVRTARLIATLPDPDNEAEEWGEVVCGECLSVFDTEAELDAHRERHYLHMDYGRPSAADHYYHADTDVHHHDAEYHCHHDADYHDYDCNRYDHHPTTAHPDNPWATGW